jgi:2-methylcitrate dehydratase
MRRREFIAGLGSIAASPLMARAEAPGPYLADRLAAYAEGLQFADLDAATIEAAKAHLIDALGCAISALDEEPVRICREVARSGRGGAATILGTGDKTTVDLAAFANGVAVRYYDLNDFYFARGSGHPSDNVTPCLAVAEAEQANGEALLTAIVLAYEIDCRLMDAVDLGNRGWDHPIYSLPAAALAAGKLMRLGKTKLTQAVNIALNGHIAMNQTRLQALSDWKGVADADAGRNAVFAALLARAGLTGPAPIFEGEAGLFKQVTGPFELDVGAFGGRGARFKVRDCSIKPYPAQGYSQTAIPAAVAVAQEAGGTGHIARIEIATTRVGYSNAGRDPEKWAPKTKGTADHSLPYIVARAMFDGDITNASYAPDKISDPHILEFMKRITVREDPALTALQPKAVPNRVTASLDDGRTVSRQVDNLPGFAERPVERPDVERKFRGNVAGRLTAQQMRAALDALWNLEGQHEVSPVVASLATKS